MERGRNQPSQPLPAELRAALVRLRTLIRRYVLAQGGIFAAVFAIVCFWIFAGVDYLPILLGANESPKIARMVMLAVFGLGTLYAFIRWGLAKSLTSWSMESLALLVERRYPQLHSNWSTAVSISRASVANDKTLGNVSNEIGTRFPELILEQSKRSLQEVAVDRVIEWRPLRRQSILLLAIVLVSGVAFAIYPAWSIHWAKRFFGLSDEAWPRLVQLRVEGLEMDIPSFTGEVERNRYLRKFESRSAKVARGRGGVLRVAADRRAKRVPEYCTFFYNGADGTRGRANLRRIASVSEDWQPFVLEGPPIESIDEPITFSVAAEDRKLPGYSIELVEAPLLVDLALEVNYPPYLQKTSPSSYLPETLQYRNGIRIPQGTSLTLVGRANKVLSRVEYVLRSSSTSIDAKPNIQSSELTSDALSIPVGSMDSTLFIELRLWDHDGLCADRIQQYIVAVVADEVPQVDLVLQGVGTAVTPNAMIPLRGTVQDDYGPNNSWIELVLNESPLQKFPVDLNRDGQLEKTLDLKSMREEGTLQVDINSTLSFTVAAEDYFDLAEVNHVGRASPLQLAVVSEEALLVLLEKRELAMRYRLELIMSEMMQMRELLQKLGRGNDETISNSDTASDPTATEEAADPKQDLPPQVERDARISLLRAQQSAMQASKSTGELRGVEQEIGHIALELVNNRIDSQDRRERLESKVQRPIQGMLEQEFAKLSQQLKDLEASQPSIDETHSKANASLKTTDEIIVGLNEVLRNMIDIQDFNEVVDMVRELIDQQQKLLDQTKKEQKKQVLDLFK